jgi:phosphohistidine swiveling domain-containing protein
MNPEPIVRPLADVRASDLGIVGGKAANLGELVANGFPVPDGFVLATDAYHAAADSAGVDPSRPEDAAERLRIADLPPVVVTAVLEAYRSLGGGPVAVRSSATAEDLPGASFAGQQDTYLGVKGDEELLDAIRRCWASLWNERAVAYRRNQGIDDEGVGLAVVVQRMVDAAAAGVLFTADPVTGRRDRAVVDAVHGLGDAVVSGSVDPDHYATDPETGAVDERIIRGSAPALTDAQVLDLATIGRQIEQALGSPQDIEFAFDADRHLWILQARPITTLFPLPERSPVDEGIRVYFSASVAQGYFDPITPMGVEPFLVIGRTLARAFARARTRTRDDAKPIRSPILVSGGRLWADVTPALRDPIGRDVLERLTSVGEARSSVIFHRLAEDRRFASRRGSRLATLRTVVPLFARSGIPITALRLLRSPDRTRARLIREIERATKVDLPADATATDRLNAVEDLLARGPSFEFPRLIGLVVAGMVSYLAAGRLLRGRATDDELQTLTRGLPNNPTTEMDLALWALTTQVRADPSSRDAILSRQPADLARAYRDGALQPTLQSELTAFIDRFGFRAVGEIDLGVPRWSEDPSYLLGAIANYLRLEGDAIAPDEQFRSGAREADATIETLLARVRGPRRHLLRFVLGRVRALMGSRELPKFMLIRTLFTPIRELLLPVGEELAAAGRVVAWDDVYFLTLAEVRDAVAGADQGELVATRRTTHARERARRYIPRVLLSDGTDAEAALIAVPEGALRGSPASPGTVTGPARTILSPHGARLEPGEILVAPSTDPGWTPLFLTAGGLVMEMGGMMSHGAVVAREYGIPAVVGVPGATERIETGVLITVDGSAGVVSIDGG